MVKVTMDSVIITSDSGNGKKLELTALGGPSDSVLATMEFENKKLGMEVVHDDLERFRKAIIDFFNTGFFNREV